MSKTFSVRFGSFVLAALLGLAGVSQARILIREADGGTNLVARAPELSATDLLISWANFSTGNSGIFEQWKEDVHRELEDLGFTYRWQAVMDDQTVSVWYAPALDKSVICLESVTESGLTHQAYRMTGPLSRKGYFLW